jgi:CRP/FNR family transcriptional regulator, cyclic AMP receptor protein
MREEAGTASSQGRAAGDAVRPPGPRWSRRTRSASAWPTRQAADTLLGMKRLRPGDYRELLRSGRWFAALPDPLQTALLDGAVLSNAVAGQRVLARGDEASGLYAVVDGTVRVCGVSEAGRELLHMVIEPPSWFGEVSVIDGLPRTQDAIADVDSTLLHVPQRALSAILSAEPRYWQHIAMLAAHKLRLAMLALEDAGPVKPLVRLARRLTLLIDGYGDHTHRRRTVELRQEQLAMMLNLSRQTTNQLLKELEARRIVKLAYGEVEILDAAALRALSEL